MSKTHDEEIASIIESRAAAIETLDDDIMMETVGVEMALDELRESLDKVTAHLNDREFEKASSTGYNEMAHNFVYVQRTLAGIQSVEHQKHALISDIARLANTAYENVAPYVEKRMSSSVTNDDRELVRGSGNVYRDFGRPNAGLEQARTIIAAKIIGVLDDRKLSTRDAEKLTGVSHAEFSRIRNTQLRRFTLDRMIAILGKLDEDVEVNVTFRPRQPSVDRLHPL